MSVKETGLRNLSRERPHGVEGEPLPPQRAGGRKKEKELLTSEA